MSQTPVTDYTTFSVIALRTHTWPLFEDLLGPGGLQGGCWCAYFRMSPQAFRQSSPHAHRELIRDRVQAGTPVGLLATRAGQPHGWIAVAPRTHYPRLTLSSVARTPEADLSGVWSVTCLYVDVANRGTGLSELLVGGALDYAAQHHARAVEAYPVDADGMRIAPRNLYHGELKTFINAGFELTERRGRRRALVRHTLHDRRAATGAASGSASHIISSRPAAPLPPAPRRSNSHGRPE